MNDQAILFATLLVTLGLFVWGRWRYDVVALLALLTVTVTGIVPGNLAFAGFGHPAVVTVAAVLAVSRGLENSGLVDDLVRGLARVGHRPLAQLTALTLLVTVCSAFINNVGALALMMPVAIQMARRSGQSPSSLLMPLAFGSLLGGMTTLIGTPPNIIISTFRTETGAEPFSMFAFTPVGAVLAVVGVLYLVLVGWRLIPRREAPASADELFQIGDYLSEVRIPPESPLAGKTLHHVENSTDAEITVLGITRNDRRIMAPWSMEVLQAEDSLIVEAEPNDLKRLLEQTDLKLIGDEKESRGKDGDLIAADNIRLLEATVRPSSPMRDKTASSLDLRWRYHINLLAVARQGRRLQQRLSQIRFAVGDILLLQGPEKALHEALPKLGCLPLADRPLKLGQQRRVLLALSLFGAGVASAALGWSPIQVALTGVAVLMVLVGLLSLRDAYASIDWPVIVLLGAMIPVGQALQTTGGAELIANQIHAWGKSLPPAVTLIVVLVGTMFLSDVINNAAAAVLVAPIAVSLADGLSVSADPFLMSVAIGASCPFLTPIGHQSNTLVMVPGGYRFGDYWRVGLPLEILIVIVGVPAILWFWPLVSVHP